MLGITFGQTNFRIKYIKKIKHHVCFLNFKSSNIISYFCVIFKSSNIIWYF
jgi:hypothetical protein